MAKLIFCLFFALFACAFAKNIIEVEETIEDSEEGDLKIQEKRNTFISGFTSNSIQTVLDLLAALAAQEQNDFNSLTSDLIDIAATLAGIVTDLDHVNSHLDDFETRLSNLAAAVTDLDGDVADLDGDVEAAKNAILADVASKASDIKSNLTAEHAQTISDINSNVDGNHVSTQNNANAGFTALTGVVNAGFAAVDSKLDDIITDISDTNTNIDDTRTAINSNIDDTQTALEDYIDDAEEDIRDQMTFNVTSILNALEAHDYSVDMQIASMFTQIESMKELTENSFHTFFHAVDDQIDSLEDVKDVVKNFLIHGFLDDNDYYDHHLHKKK